MIATSLLVGFLNLPIEMKWLGLGGSVLAGLYMTNRWLARRRVVNQYCRPLCERRRGRMLWALIPTPCFTFRHDEHEVTVRLASSFGWTKIEVRLPSLLKDGADWILTSDRRFAGDVATAPLNLPVRGIDRVTTNSPEQSISLLGEPGLWLLSEWVQSQNSARLYLRMDREHCLITGEIKHATSSLLDDWLSKGIALYDQIQVQGRSEIAFGSDAPEVSLTEKDRRTAIGDRLLATTLGGSTVKDRRLACGICGQSVEKEWVVCCKCKTPHHQDCWEFNGRCSTFGCGASEYEIARTIS